MDIEMALEILGGGDWICETIPMIERANLALVIGSRTSQLSTLPLKSQRYHTKVAKGMGTCILELLHSRAPPYEECVRVHYGLEVERGISRGAGNRHSRILTSLIVE